MLSAYKKALTNGNMELGIIIENVVTKLKVNTKLSNRIGWCLVSKLTHILPLVSLHIS